jgi:hypothetical protein
MYARKARTECQTDSLVQVFLFHRTEFSDGWSVPNVVALTRGNSITRNRSSNFRTYCPSEPIQLNNLQKQGKVNALEESISPDDAVDPYFDFEPSPTNERR